MNDKTHDEILEALWMAEESGKSASLATLKLAEQSQSLHNILAEMQREELVSSSSRIAVLTHKGRIRAREIIRCHRLAERLLADVLSVGDSVMEAEACQFEHILSPEVAEHICTLLGHPRTCPHGRPIPPGDCCDSKRREVGPIVVPLSSFRSGESGTIAYIESPEIARLDRLMAFGLIPGSTITLVQRRPAFVLQSGETQLAIDDDVARHIYLKKGQPQLEVKTIERRRRNRLGLRRRGSPE